MRILSIVIMILNCNVLVFSQVTVRQVAVKIIAHRGASSIAPENTLAAFQKAIDLGADYFELDIRKSKDDSLMIIHDNTLDRTTDGTGSVRDYNYSELKQFDAGYASKFEDLFANERIPSLYESLILAKNKINVCIELKEKNIENKVLELVERVNMKDQVIILAFDYDQLKNVKSIDSDMEVLYLKITSTKNDIDKVVDINGKFIAPNSLVTKSLVNYAHDKGVEMWNWTVNDPYNMLSLIEKGIDGIITDYPQSLSALINVNITAYPNPFDKSINIEVINATDDTFLSVYDLNGNLVALYDEVKDRNIIWEPSFPGQGIYILNTYTEGVSISKKIMYYSNR